MADGIFSNYEYAIDNANYQNNNVFYNLTAGEHTAYAKSFTGCGIDTYNFVVYIIPRFFSPNGDNINDVFTIEGMHALTDANVTIFDRYGKIITVLNRSNPFWDGSFDGKKLPATDYWYHIIIDHDTPEIKGHFSLIR